MNNPEGDPEIFAMNPDRTGLEQITTDAVDNYDPAWSADGRFIAWASLQDSNVEIFMWNYARSSLPVPNPPKRLTTTADGHDLAPSFNHDGTKIAFQSNRQDAWDSTDYDIYVMDTTDTNNDGNGDNPTNLLFNDLVIESDDEDPAFSPDGTKIAFTTDWVGNSEIYVMDADGTDLVNLTHNIHRDFTPTWSPDGTKIAFVRDVSTDTFDSNFEIFVMNADGSGQKRLTKNRAFDSHPAFSPDGKKIAFTSDRDGDNEIYVMKAKPESRRNRPVNLTRNDVSDIDPDWRPIVQP